ALLGTDVDGAASGVSYQWFADDFVIGGATDSSFTLGAAEVGKHISVAISYTDGQGFIETQVSGDTELVAAVNDGTAEVGVGGTAIEHGVLTAILGTDVDGTASDISYQWFTDGTAISGATADSYTLSAAEVGKHVSVTVNYTDGQNYVEQVSSAASAVV